MKGIKDNGVGKRRDQERPGWTGATIRVLFSTALALLVVSVPHIRGAHAQTTRFVAATGGNDMSGMNDCSSPGQPCSTIQNAVNHSGSGDEIDLGPGTYVENVTISHNVTIRGDSVTGSTVDGNAAGSVFVVDEGVSATLDTLTIKNGSATPVTEGVGGGIANMGTLTVTGCAITGNSAPQTVVVVNPTTTVTFVGLGGGISSGGNLTLINSTVGRNSANSQAGGIFNSGTASLVNCTITENRAGGDGGVVNDVLAVLSLTNTIIAGNTALDCDNTANQLAKNDHNFIGDGSCSPALSGDPMLGPFQNNGGPTFTYALLTGSPAIDAGDDSVLSDPLNLTTDQRGAGFPRKGCTHVDIGAYETSTPPTVTCPSDISTVTDPGKGTATVSFAATAVSSCGGALTPVYKIGSMEITSTHVFPPGLTAVTASATDSQGHTGSCSFVVDVTCAPPTINCPVNMSVPTDPGKTTATVAFAAAAADPCDGVLTPVYKIGNTVITSPFAFPPGATTVTAIATGSNGMTGTCAFTVSVILLNICIQDDHTGDTFRFNSTTGQYLYTRCRDKFAMSGAGVVGNSSGLVTLTDNRPDRRISAAANAGSLTGRANITLILAPGVSQTITVNQTKPVATCACP